MKKNVISENVIKVILEKIILEEASKVKREEYNRVQYKIDELNGSLNDTIKELRKLEDSIPNGLNGLVTSKINTISNNFNNSQKLITQLKEKIKHHKKLSFTQQVVEKK
jgi:flagellar biosynthesis chaperone FliJ